LPTARVGICERKAISGFPSVSQTDILFGDVVIDEAGETLYGAQISGVFFKVNLVANPPVYALIKGSSGPNLQLAFDDQYKTLYGTVLSGGNAGKWYTVNIMSGVATPLPSGFTSTFFATDLGGPSCLHSSAVSDPYLVGANGTYACT